MLTHAAHGDVQRVGAVDTRVEVEAAGHQREDLLQVALLECLEDFHLRRRMRADARVRGCGRPRLLARSVQVRLRAGGKPRETDC